MNNEVMVVNEDDKQEFEDKCEAALNDGYVMVNVSTGITPDGNDWFFWYIAVFHRANNDGDEWMAEVGNG